MTGETNTNPDQSRQKPFNPYLRALALVASRLRWDLRPESFRSRKRLRAIRGTRSGKAVILCNGPSLLRTDFERLRESGAWVFGLNKINLLFERTPLRPDAIVAVNPYVIEQNRDFYDHCEIPLFLDSRALGTVAPRPGVTFLHSAPVRKFCADCSLSIDQGYTVTFVALQLAYHMGFRHVALVGCDHAFSQDGPANQLATAHGDDRSHFDPRYFSDGMRWQLPDLVQSEASYLLALQAYAGDGRELVNCTEGGALEVLPRRPLADFLED